MSDSIPPPVYPVPSSETFVADEEVLFTLPENMRPPGAYCYFVINSDGGLRISDTGEVQWIPK